MSTSQKTEVAELVAPFAGRPTELIQALHRVQRAHGYISPPAQRTVAAVLGVPLSQVHGVMTFYHYFRSQPAGEHTLQLCLGTACYVRGAERVLKTIQDELGIGLGGTSEDGKFSLTGVRCLGACGLAPVMMVDGEVYGKLDPKRVRSIIRRLRRAP
ncbi:MAG: NADH-quinone oxidoreductase subunit NuoE [Candidatus Bipolaricaulaceae bacterium]